MTDTKRVAIIQSSYIPWKGYFDIIHDVDEFIFLDDVQFTKQDWRSRNRIKTSNGLLWLTVPSGSGIHRRICDVEIADRSWQSKHWKSILLSYSRAPFFDRYRPFLEEVYLTKVWQSLSEFNQHMIVRIASEFLGIRASFRDSRAYCSEGQKQERLISLLKQAGATHYVSGPAARDYIEDERFAEAGIALSYKDYGGYPEYRQLHPPFEHAVSILDLLFHQGDDAPQFIWGWRDSSTANME